MFSFFTDPYEDEILYSVIARYHYYSGNVDLKDTLKEVFGKRSCVPSIELPSNLEYLSSKLGKKGMYGSKCLIDNYTIFPYYAPFLPLKRRTEIESEMKNDDGKGIYTKIGLVAGSVCSKQGLQYCSLCAKADMERYGETYFHRVHQLQGVFVCPEHGCLLKTYVVTRKEESRLFYIRLDYKNITFNVEYEKNDAIAKHLMCVARAARYLLKHNLYNYHQEEMYKIYRKIIGNKNLLSINGFVKQEELHNNFKAYYGDEFLNKLESNIIKEDESNWLKAIVRKSRKVIHPLRHILFILFLCNDIETLFENTIKDNRPFGIGPWPCLNPVAEHYKENVMNNCIITADYKTRQPVGTFTCSCGFVYSRKGPDKSEEDKYKIGRIKIFGSVWEGEFKKFLSDKKYGVREIGRVMGCDPKTALKYAKRLNLLESINTEGKIQKVVIKESRDYKQEFEAMYKKDILDLMYQHPEFMRKQIRENLKKQYMWFYRNNRAWLEQNLPVSIPRGLRNQDGVQRVDWNLRDGELVKRIKDIYSALLKLEKPVRITKSLIGKKLGKSALLEVYIERLPTTKEYINSIIETVEDFQIRRIDKICTEFYKKSIVLKKWEVVRKAGLRFNYSKRVEEKILESINILTMQ